MSGTSGVNTGRSLWLKLVFVCGVIFLMTPLFLLVLFSFNASRNITQWGGFSLAWYRQAFQDAGMWTAVRNSVAVALLSTAISTVLGTLAAVSIGMRRFRGRGLFLNLVHVPIILPEIVAGISLLTLFTLVGMPLGIVSVVCAHATFSMSFVTIIVLASVRHFDREIEQAAMDLGATRLRAFFDVVLPLIAPGIVSGALFAFSLSIDDFVVTFFTTGSGFTTFPLKVYSMLKYGVNPSINAVSTLLILATCAAVAGAGLLQLKKDKLEGRLKYVTGGLLALTVGLVALVSLLGSGKKTIVFANYSSYFDESIARDFEKATGVRVTVDYINGQEALLSKLQAGSCSYDVMVVSDYMVEVMRRQSLIAPLDFALIPNIRHITPSFRRMYFDPSGEYCAPYAFGFTSIGYDADHVKEPVDSWKALWDARYKDRVALVDDMRSVLAIPYILLGYSINDTDPRHLEEAANLLLEQKKIVKKYESNRQEEMYQAGEIVLSQIWSGAMLRLNRANPKFRFVIPKEGALVYVDNFCVRKGSENFREASQFIDFVLRRDMSARNISTICYAMPNEGARKLLPPELRDNPILFPTPETIGRCHFLRDVGPFLKDMSREWTEIKGE